MKPMMKMHDQFLKGEPQRQSVEGILVEGLVGAYKYMKAFWYFLAFAIFRLMRHDILYLYLGLAFALLCIVVIGYLRYRHFSFYLDKNKGEFVLTEGVFSKKRVAIQLSKIQQVNVNQSLLQRLMKVYGVEINTAGSTQSEAVIPAVRWEVAQALRQHLLPQNGEEYSSVTQPFDTNKDKPLFTIRTESLVKHGLTARYMESFSLLLAFLFAIYNNVKDLIRLQNEDEEQVDALISSFFVVNSVVVFLIGLFVLAIVINLVRTVLTYYQLQLRKEHQKLAISYGLLQKRTTLLNPQKVQMLRIVANVIQRKLGLYWLTVKQASSDAASDTKSNIHFPGMSSDEKDLVFGELFGQLPQTSELLRPSIRMFWVNSILWGLLPAILYWLVGYLGYEEAKWGWGMLYLLTAVGVSWRNYRNSSLAFGTDFIIRKEGFWDISTYYLEPYKIQGIKTKQYFWQRSNNTGEVTLYTSGGSIHFTYGAYDQIQACVNHWLMVVETSKKPWM
jgi:putative membrane protein